MVQVQSLITIYLGLSLAPPNSHSFSTSVLDITPNDKQVKLIPLEVEDSSSHQSDSIQGLL